MTKKAQKRPHRSRLQEADDLQKEVDARFAFYDAMSKDTEGQINL